MFVRIELDSCGISGEASAKHVVDEMLVSVILNVDGLQAVHKVVGKNVARLFLHFSNHGAVRHLSSLNLSGRYSPKAPLRLLWVSVEKKDLVSMFDKECGYLDLWSEFSSRFVINGHKAFSKLKIST